MADKQASTVLTVQVGGASVDIDSIAKAKKAIKDLNSEVLKGNKEALKSLADVKDRLEDVKEATDTVKGSGVEKLTSSFSLLSQGFTSFDADKIKTGFKGIGSAMGAIPIFLLIEGVQLLIQNFDVVIKFVNDFIGVTDDGKKAVDKLVLSIGQESDALKVLTQASDNYTQTELLNAKLRGASDEELAAISKRNFRQKIKDTQESIDILVKEYNALLTNEEATKEQLDESFKTLQATKAAKKQLENDAANFDIQIKIDEKKRQEDQNKDLLAKNKEFAAQRLADQKAANEELLKENKRIFDEFAKVGALGDEFRKQLIDDQKNIDQSIIDSNELFKQLSAEQDAVAQRSRDENLAKTKEKDAIERQTQENFFNAARGLSDAFFAGQLNAAQGNEQKRNEILKKQFSVEKAFNIARATIDGIRSVQSALTIPPPLGNILAVSNALLAAANVAKIAAVKFQGASDSGASSSGGTVSSPTIASTPAAPQLNTGTGGTTSTIINNNGLNEPLQAYVVEGQSRAVTERINRIRKSATFG